MKYRYFVILIIFIFLPNVLSAQADREKSDDFFISAGGGTLMYGFDSIAYGGGLMFGYGSGMAMALSTSFYVNAENLSILEFNFILRFYLTGAGSYKGPFLQFMGGPSIINRSGNFSLPSLTGTINAGLCGGWRFLFNDRWFIEPSVRGGYPFIVGAGISSGVRF